MKRVRIITCTMILILVVFATASAKSGIISTTKSGTIPTTRMGQIPTTRTALTPSTEIIPTARTRSTSNADRFSLAELFWTVFGW
jgi:hypothetical protein